MPLAHELVAPSHALPFHGFTFKASDYSRIIAPHWHESTELIYCLAGALNVNLIQQQLTMKAGDVLVINPTIVHSTHSPAANHILCLQLPLPLMRQLTAGRFNRDFIIKLNTVVALVPAVTALRATLDHLLPLLERSSLTLADTLEEQSLVYHLLAQILGSDQLLTPKPAITGDGIEVEQLAAIMSYIDQHAATPLPLTQIAQHFGYSDSHFSRLFHRNFNMTYRDFLTSVRLNQATHLLRRSDLTVKAIAEQCGFTHYRNFYNAFVRVHQMTPNQYRATT